MNTEDGWIVKSGSAEKWAIRIQRKLAESVEAIVDVGRDFIAARKALPHGEFGRLAELLNLDGSTVRRFMAIAGNEILSNRAHVNDFPPSWGTLYELSRLDSLRLQLAMDQGKITPTLERSDARALVASYKKLDLGETTTHARQNFRRVRARVRKTEDL